MRFALQRGVPVSGVSRVTEIDESLVSYTGFVQRQGRAAGLYAPRLPAASVKFHWDRNPQCMTRRIHPLASREACGWLGARSPRRPASTASIPAAAVGLHGGPTA
jgi:hypothetical protein